MAGTLSLDLRTAPSRYGNHRLLTLCWIPSWARSSFSLPLHTLVLSSNVTYKLDFSNFLYGESWASCWK
ncbi:hypothetical protein L210DRAFT_3540220 [Boletus edulis BED1]|uniref:Uncharacterized protein n=1 Tax=Boletus edulis BED1 TaxID=1328754 RepID=A0AAD4GFD7_BOLED|nr:hypothetical protein L210DRAFT_3583137 [Boletus edulis BED1]KAF8439748.1 hypothetical protein L210DRAFT_3540220 [Boletus edulis BED1]